MSAAVDPSGDPAGPGARDAPPTLPRELGLRTAVAVVAGAIIGASIFRVPAKIAAEVGGGGAILALWVLGALIAIAGALSLAELAAAYPNTGGMYVYLRETYGRWAAFLFGWAMLVVNSASYAGLALLLGQSVALLAPSLRGFERELGLVSLLLLVAINVRPVRVGARLLEATTWAKVLALLVLSVAAILCAQPDAPAREFAMEPRSWGGAGFALILVLGAYDGWQWAPQLGGEMRDPRRDLPRAILLGLLAVAAVFLVANVANLLVLAPDELEHSPLVTADVAARLLGPAGMSLVALLVIVATFSSNHSGMMTDPRVLYAMAEDGLFPRAVARLHPRHRTPHVAVILIGAAAALYLYARTFEELVATFVLGMWPFLALSIAAVIVQRVRKPDLPRPYRVPLYPLVPLFFLLACAGIFANSFVEEPRFTLVNLGVLAAGLPVYALWRWKQRSA